MSTPAAILPFHASTNLAPLKPILQVRAGIQKPETGLQKALQEKLKWYLSLERVIWNSMYTAGYEVSSYINGQQLITPNRFMPGQFLSYTPKDSTESTKRALNLMRFYASNCEFKWQLSNPNIRAIAGVDTQQAREAAEAADTIIEHYERQFFQPFISRQEAFQGLCWGTYIWRVRYDDTKKSVTVENPIYQDQQVSLNDGIGMCDTCGYQGTAMEQQCPSCGGAMAVMEPPAQGAVPSVTGSETMQLGDLVAELMPFPECRWDIRCRVEDSSWFIHQRRTSTIAVQRLLGNVQLPGQGEQEDIGLDIAEKLAWAGAGGGRASINGRKPKLYENPAVVVEMSLGPDDIADIIIKADEETLGGQVIPAGPLIDSFPEGLTVQGINGLGLITGLFSEHHSVNTTSGVWHAKAMSGVGTGLHDTVEVQKRFNADDSQIHTFMRATATPAMLIRQEAIGDTNRMDYLGIPHANIPINGQNLPDGMRLEDIVRPAFQPQSVPGTVFTYVYERLNDFAQLTSHVTDFSGGLPNVNNRTATGAQITQANSNALFTPPLQVKGEVRKRIAEIVLDLYRTHFPTERYFPGKGKHSRQGGKFLSAANLTTDVRLEVVRDSELPRNDFIKREDYTAFFQMVGGGAGYVQLREMDPEFTAEMERTFGIDIKGESYDHIASLCTQRIDQMKPMAMMLPDPMMLLLLIQPPVTLFEPNHELKAKWFSEWLDEDEGQAAPPVLRQAVELLIQQHFVLFSETVAALAAVQGIANPQDEEGGEEGDKQGGASESKPKKSSEKFDSSAPSDPNKPTPITGRPKSNKK